MPTQAGTAPRTPKLEHGVAALKPPGVQLQPLMARQLPLLLSIRSLFLLLDPLSGLPPPPSFHSRKSPGAYSLFLRSILNFISLCHSATEKPPPTATSNVSQPPPPPSVPPAPLEPPREPTPPPAPAQEPEPTADAQTGWEEPTTVQNPPWEDDLQPKSSAPVTEPWDTAPAEEIKVADDAKPAPPESTPVPEPVPEPIAVSLPAPQPKEPVSGLNEAIPKHVAPVQPRPSSAAHRHSARFKTDQAVTLPNNFGSGLEKVGMQFGSLSIGGDEIVDAKPSVTLLPGDYVVGLSLYLVSSWYHLSPSLSPNRPASPPQHLSPSRSPQSPRLHNWKLLSSPLPLHPRSTQHRASLRQVSHNQSLSKRRRRHRSPHNPHLPIFLRRYHSRHSPHPRLHLRSPPRCLVTPINLSSSNNPKPHHKHHCNKYHRLLTIITNSPPINHYNTSTPSMGFRPTSTPRKRNTSHRFPNNKYPLPSIASQRRRDPTSTPVLEHHPPLKHKTAHMRRSVN